MRKTLSNTKFSLLVIILTLVAFFRLGNSGPRSVGVLFAQWTTLVLITALVLAFLIVLYNNITIEYFTYFEKSYIEFNRLMKIGVLLVMILTFFIVNSTQKVFINAFLEPSLESCSYYDWYGNRIYASDQIGDCPTIQNLETEFLTSIQFGVIQKDKSGFTYIGYDYRYENEKLIKREVTSYLLSDKNQTKSEIINQPILSHHLIENTYSENKFISNQTYTEYKMDGTILINEEDIIQSELNLDNEIIVTKETKPNSVVTELYRFNLHDDSQSTQFFNGAYSVSKWKNRSVGETYYGKFLYVKIPETKYIEYIPEYYVTYTATPIINSMLINEQYNYFEVINNIHDTEILEINHYLNEELLYKNLFKYKDYGYQVKHYSYYRDKRGKIIDSAERYDDSYCYFGNGVVNSNDFEYDRIIQERLGNYCTTPLFYTENPLFLGY